MKDYLARPSWRTCMVFSALAACLLSTWAVGLDPSQPDSRDILRREAVEQGEYLWARLATGDVPGRTSCRAIIGYALALAEARAYPERLDQLLRLLEQMQDRQPASPTFGNLRWYWEDSGVNDPNAVEFCVHDALLLWLRHRDWMPEAPRERLRKLMQLAGQACIRHPVDSGYTNIALMNVGNLLLLGETLTQPELAAEGGRRLDAIFKRTAAYGTHEFCSGTYYGIDLGALMLIATQTHNEHSRRQAEALLQLLWTDIALNWFPRAGRLGGSQSRTSDYLSGLGAMDWYLWVNGWFQSPTPGKAERAEPFWQQWKPSPQLWKMSREQLPRLVRQSWGQRSAESRTAMVFSDITLSCIGAGYGRQDVPLVVDLAGPREAARCYFMADGREDPYGKKKFKPGADGHAKPLHLTPFWIGAQRASDAVGLAIYRDKDIDPSKSPIANLQSHLVLRRDADAIWVGGRRVSLRTAGGPATAPIAGDDSVVLRYGTAAIGLRVLVATRRGGGAARVSLVDDGNPYGCIRLTIEHGLERTWPASATGFPLVAAGLWVRVASGLRSDAGFDAWRHAFEAARPASATFVRDTILVEVSGVQGAVAVSAHAPFDSHAITNIVPEPCRGVLELNGTEIGRAMLAEDGANTGGNENR